MVRVVVLAEKQQQMEAEQQGSYVPADQDLHSFLLRSSVAPPLERPGERRTAEMKKLYGGDAAKIMAMEAAMQLNFERNCDLKQPKYWPVIPLKLWRRKQFDLETIHALIPLRAADVELTGLGGLKLFQGRKQNFCSAKHEHPRPVGCCSRLKTSGCGSTKHEVYPTA